ncbi:unnamed protein product, partial [Ectocarpus fasciculatus]
AIATTSSHCPRGRGRAEPKTQRTFRVRERETKKNGEGLSALAAVTTDPSTGAEAIDAIFSFPLRLGLGSGGRTAAVQLSRRASGLTNKAATCWKPVSVCDAPVLVCGACYGGCGRGGDGNPR